MIYRMISATFVALLGVSASTGGRIPLYSESGLRKKREVTVYSLL